MLTIDAKKSKKFSVILRGSDVEETVLRYDASGKFVLDRSNAGLPIHIIDPHEIFDDVREVQITPADKLKLQIFVDRSSVEVFINDGAEVLSARIYPKRTSQKVIFIPDDEIIAIDSVEFYKLDFGLPHPHIKDTTVDLKQFPFLKG